MANFSGRGGMGGGFGGMNLVGMLGNLRQAQPNGMPRRNASGRALAPNGNYNGRQVAPMTETPPEIEDPPLPPLAPEKKKLSWAQQMAKNIKWAARNSGGSGMGVMAAMMGMPMQQKRGNMWMTIDPQRHSVYPSGTTPYYGPGSAGYGNGGGGDDTPPTDPNNPPLPADKYPKNMIPEWWKEWYRTQGQYGGVPPVDGLL